MYPIRWEGTGGVRVADCTHWLENMDCVTAQEHGLLTSSLESSESLGPPPCRTISLPPRTCGPGRERKNEEGMEIRWRKRKGQRVEGQRGSQYSETERL